MIYDVDYGRLWVELTKQLRLEFGIEVPERWERRVCLGERDVSLKQEITEVIERRRLER